jgi:hypothetical protein
MEDAGKTMFFHKESFIALGDELQYSPTVPSYPSPSLKSDYNRETCPLVGPFPHPTVEAPTNDEASQICAIAFWRAKSDVHTNH